MRRFAARGWESETSAVAAAFSEEVLRRDGDRFAAEISASIRAEVAGLEALPPDVMAELVKADLDRAIGAISERRLPNEQELAVSAATAANLARAGVSIDTVLQARRVAIRRSCELLREEGAKSGLDPDSQVECIYRMWEWADAIQVADAEAHRTAEAEMNGRGEEERAWFVRALLEGTLTPGEVSGRATAYGLLPGSRYRAFRARPAPGADIRALGRAIEATGVADGFGVLTATVDGDLCGVVSRRPEIPEGIVGLGPETELGRLDSSFELANRALETAVAFSYDGVVTMEDLSLRSAVMAETHLGEHLVRRYIGPLQELGEFGATLEETVREYLSHGMRIDESAKALFVHPNTLRHRLDRFQQLTGADLRNTEEVLEIWWALQRRGLDARLTGTPRETV
ncbi:MAG TPA: helix-turn-helix domain-containing protein [Thermoleophilaceae bacterium]|jgi:putative transposase